LIEPQHLSRERHAQGHEQKKHSQDPSQLSRKLVGPEEEDLNHVDENDGDHEIGCPTMEGSNEPAQRDLVIQCLEAAVCLAGARYVDEGQKNAGDDLQTERGESRAAEHIKPAGRLAWNRMLHRFANDFSDLQAMVEPRANFWD
jgi:hypothetical protein